MADRNAIHLRMKRSRQQMDTKLVNAWNVLLPKDGSGKLCKKQKKSKTVEQAKADKKENDQQQFLKDINNLKKPLANKFY